MPEKKKAAGVQTGKPSNDKNNPSMIFASLWDIRQGVLKVARIEDHAARAGSRAPGDACLQEVGA
jgi:hypothetical protein